MTVLTLAQLSISMEDGKVLRWLVAEGEPVRQGDAIVEVETDKATMEVESPADGILRIVAGEGEIVPVDGVLGVLEGPDGELAEIAGGRNLTTADRPASGGDAGAPVAEAGLRDDGASGAGPDGGRPTASPAARRLARAQGIDLTGVSGSGPGGRIVVRDLDAPPPGPVTPAPAGAAGLREAVVRNIVASWQQIPHVQIGGELEADGLVAARAAAAEAGLSLTYTDLLARALAQALAEVPELNGTLGPDGVVARSEAVHLSLAVATTEGVVAPVIRDVGRRSLGELAAERARLVAAAREGVLDRRSLAGGTVTLSNLGAYPVDFFAPVVSGPQVAMVATGRVADRPVAADGWIAVRARIWVNVAIDHRAADGAAGGRLLAALERRFAAAAGEAA